MSEWISVKDRLPGEGEKVLLNSEGDYYVAELSMTFGNYHWSTENDNFRADENDLWMEIPQ